MKKDVSFAPRRQTISPLLGGVFALSYPLALVVIAISVGFRRSGDVGEFAATMAASFLFLVAAPTTWVLSFSFIDVTRFTVLVFGVITSLPLWFLAGTALTRGVAEWIIWMKRYVVVVVAWTSLNLLAFAVLASLSS
ncbi:hypothetical protein MNBD_ACTINO01-2057 [hydrothermal vent metagenome]|uniref:Uncharacterized protein n=1 Tax=hydrothermal vent metagenome TaxID=652676 RepID=A0A3B0SVJ3_9ZZZZ